MDLLETEVNGMSTIITNIGTLVGGVGTWVGEMIEVITTSGNELLFFAVLLPFIGIGISLLKRLLSVRP